MSVDYYFVLILGSLTCVSDKPRQQDLALGLVGVDASNKLF